MNEKQISLLIAFAAAGVEFVVVGGIAVNMHGYVRATNDMHLFIRPSVANARAAFDLLVCLGATWAGMTADDLLSDGDQVRIGEAENYIDVLPSIGEMPFDQVWRNRVEMEVGGIVVPFISFDDLIANKQQVGRLRDLANVGELLALRMQSSKEKA